MEQGLRIVGVLGGVGSGKSTAARCLAEATGGQVLDADRVVTELLGQEEVVGALERATGKGLRNKSGDLDRKALAAVIFADPGLRQRVEAVLHPRVRTRHWADLERYERAAPGTVVILDVPLLLEGGLDQICDFLIFVEAPEAVRMERARLRHGWDPAEWARREAAQRPLAEKRARADAILTNDAGADRLRTACAALADRLRGLPSSPLRERWPAPEEAPRRTG